MLILKFSQNQNQHFQHFVLIFNHELRIFLYRIFNDTLYFV